MLDHTLITVHSLNNVIGYTSAIIGQKVLLFRYYLLQERAYNDVFPMFANAVCETISSFHYNANFGHTKMYNELPRKPHLYKGKPGDLKEIQVYVVVLVNEHILNVG